MDINDELSGRSTLVWKLEHISKEALKAADELKKLGYPMNNSVAQFYWLNEGGRKIAAWVLCNAGKNECFLLSADGRVVWTDRDYLAGKELLRSSFSLETFFGLPSNRDAIDVARTIYSAVEEFIKSCQTVDKKKTELDESKARISTTRDPSYVRGNFEDFIDDFPDGDWEIILPTEND